MFEVFEDVQQGHCERQILRELTQADDSFLEDKEQCSVGVHGEVVDLNQMPGGEVVDTEGSIALKDVAIITPCGDVVVSNLSFEVSSRMKQEIVDSSDAVELSPFQSKIVKQGPVLQRTVNPIQWINHHPMDVLRKCTALSTRWKFYPMDNIICPLKN